MNTIVTHFSPDVDATCSIWLIKKFLPGFSNAEIKFVPAGQTWGNEDPDSNSEIIHVDTGFGQFDHHQEDKEICAASLIYQYLDKKGKLTNNESAVLKRLVREVNEIDHFKQVYWQEADNDRYDFHLDAVVDGLKLLYPKNDLKIIEISLPFLEAVFKRLTNKLWAEKLIEKEALKFKSRWGEALAFETTNDEVIHLAQKKGYKLVVRRDPKKNYIRIKSWPAKQMDLTQIYNKLKEKDPNATWFLHASKHMILNGSTKNPEMRPTSLSLEEIVDIIKLI